MELTYREIEYILDMNFIEAPTTGYTLSPGIYEISDFNLIIQSLIPNDVRVKIIIDDIRWRPNLTLKKR